MIYRWIAGICRSEIERACPSPQSGLRAGTEYRWASTIMCDIGRSTPLKRTARVALSGANYPDWVRRKLDRPYEAAKEIVERAIARIDSTVKIEVMG